MPRLHEHQSTADKLVCANAPARHDAHRTLGFWHVAVNATRGLFSQPSRSASEHSVSSMPLAGHRRTLVHHTSVSSPSLKEFASKSQTDLAADFVPPHSAFFNTHSFNVSPRKVKTARAAARPIISPPSLPQHLDSFGFPHSKLAYPLSPMPSPVGSTFSCKAPFLQHSSKLPTERYVSENNTIDVRAQDLPPLRRRTKSAPGFKPSKQPPFSPALPKAQESDADEPLSPVVIDIASPSTASDSLPSPPLETPKMSSDYFTQFSSPVVHASSPRSFTSVKRKPVPRYLYTDPPDHDPSVPCTPLLTPNPGSLSSGFASDAARSPGANSLHTPLLPSSELILKSCSSSRASKRDLALLPIGQPKSCNSGRGQHRRSVSEHGRGQTLSPVGELGISIPWFTTNVNGAITSLVTPVEEKSPFSFTDGLPAPPRILPQSPPQTPPRALEKLPSVSDDASSHSTSTRSGALSPLTDDEIAAIRTFIHRHGFGHRARQRRKANHEPPQQQEKLRRSSSIRTESYDLHAQILGAYLDDDDEIFCVAGSEDDEDTESRAPLSTLDTVSTSALSLLGERERDDDADADIDRVAAQDETLTAVDQVNRGTFGYYDEPIVRSPRFLHELDGIFSCAYAPGDCKTDTHVVQPREWRDGGEFGDVSQVIGSLCTEGKNLGIHEGPNNSSDCSENPLDVLPINSSARSSSLCYGSSIGYATFDNDNDFTGLRINCQPLVPRTVNSDSESDRPLSLSSASASLSASTSTGVSVLTSGIGLAIIPPEQFTHFNASCSSSECGNDDELEGSPTTLACASSPQQNQRRLDDDEYGIEGLTTSFDRLQSSLAKLRMQPTDSEDRNLQCTPGVAYPMLKPALHIKLDNNTMSTLADLPSPTDTVATYPPHTYALPMDLIGQKFAVQGSSRRQGASASADEASTRDAENMRSFMNLTPNKPAPKQRSRVRLRQLFSLKGSSGRKAAADSKS